MNALDDLIRETLDARAHDVDHVQLDTLVPRPARSRRWVAVGTVVALAAAVVVAVVLVAPWRGASHRTAVPADTTPSALPAGAQSVSFHGITLTVPADWVVSAQPCAAAPDAPGIVLVDSGNWAYDCATAPDPRRQSVIDLEPLLSPGPSGVPVTIAGHEATQVVDQPDHVEYQLPEVATVLTVRGPDEAVVASIPSRLEYTPVDHLGCAAQSPGLAFPPPGPLRPIDDVVGGVVCEYAPGRDFLLGSRTLSDADLAVLRKLATTAHPATGGLPVLSIGPGQGLHVFRLNTSAGAAVTVTASLTSGTVELWDDAHSAMTEATSVPGAYP